MATMPSVSVLLPAWNESLTLGRCLDSLLAVKRSGLEVIVCAGGSDETEAIARRYGRAHPEVITVLTQNAGEGKQVALRMAYCRSSGEVIYLTDADCVVNGDTLAALVRAVGPDGADAATGSTFPFPEQRNSSWVRHQWGTEQAVQRARTIESTGLHGRNCAVRRDAIDAAGAFRDPVKIGTDFHLAKKLLAAGRTIHFLPVEVETRFHESFLEYSAQQSRWMRNVLIHGSRFGQLPEVMNVARSIFLGTSLLAWPLTWKWTKLPGIALWMIPISWMIRTRIRQQIDLEQEFKLEPGTRRVAKAALFSLADLIVWARPTLDLFIARRRSRW